LSAAAAGTGAKTLQIVNKIAGKIAAARWTGPNISPYEDDRIRWKIMKAPSEPTPAIALSGVNLSLGQGAARVHILKDIALNIGRG